MKKLFFIVLLVFTGGVMFISCEKEHLGNDDTQLIVEHGSKNLFPTTPETVLQGEQLEYVYDLLKEMDDGDLVTFLNNYGQPAWEYSFQKRSQDIFITSIPLLKNEEISGIIKLYEIEGSAPVAHAFSMEELDKAMTRNLDTEHFYIYRGVIQSLVICASIMEQEIGGKYFEWLLETQDRVDEKIEFICVVEMECDGPIYVSPRFFETLEDEEEGFDCVILSMECYTVGIFPMLPNYSDNHTDNGEGQNQTSGPNGSDQSGSSPGSGGQHNSQITSAIEDWLDNENIEIDGNLLEIFENCVATLTAPFGGLAETVVDAECMGAEVINQVYNKLEESQVEFINEPENSDLKAAIDAFILVDNGMSQEEKVEEINYIIELFVENDDGISIFEEIINEATSFDITSPPPVNIRLLECNSFTWTQVGSGWVSCLEPNTMDIEIQGTNTFFSIDLGCLSYTVPQQRYNGQTISYDEASSCAALAANLSTVSVKLAIDITPPQNFNSSLTRFFLSKIYKESYSRMIEETDCGYGSVASCNSSNCPGGASQPQYTNDFIEVTLESLLGGCH